MKKDKLIIYTDGGSRGNPGNAGIGAVLYDVDKNIVKEISEFIGYATNNQAEWTAVIRAIEEAKKIGANELDFFLDSELVVKQLKREYKVKNKNLQLFFVKAYNLILDFKKVTFTHVPREQNKEADKLANNAMDRGV